MRYEDFDVLLFPSGSHVPLREFRTQCFAQQDPRTGVTTPLLTCFVPTMTADSAFQISVHSWTKPVAIPDSLAAAAGVDGGGEGGHSHGAKCLWRVKVVIDGATVASETFGEEGSWPKQMENSCAVGEDGKPLPLSFPRFHRTILSQSHWNACDDLGRVKLELSAGYAVQVHGKEEFVKAVDRVIFSFQPTPLDILERSGVSWPRANMPIVNNPLRGPDIHRLSNGGHGVPQYDDGSSRSTSGYSVVPPTAYPVFDTTTSYLGALAHAAGQQTMPVRLPSDQIQRIIDALSPSKPATNLAMPPPPVPHRSSSETTTPVPGRRGDSRYSDVSMHAACTNYPSCLTEDTEGRLMHSPSSVVRGKKEGLPSSPAKPRDFLSTVLDSTNALTTAVPPPSSPPTTLESSGRKRTRSALRTLTLNNGSPEKRDKPARKVSRTSQGSDKENIMIDE
ncbi:hypothetical protein LTR62_007071 [Meristemomyces frigidus]|uniref:Uncharacterized protein n=1 Tax=Meristemomyces frigidus TaxID=1508187 RepID=A0AAN7YP95_9PEZI|nr:hypothetical protein LTR62_007071 [Meristemomyces frigidus]